MCQANHGCLTQADEEARPDGPPGEDAPGAVRAAPGQRLRSGGTGPTRTNYIRLSVIHPLLGTIPTRRMGGQAEDGEQPTQACAGSAIGVVPKKSARSDQGAAPEALQKLRGHYGYCGITGNLYSFLEFREGARRIWRRKLSRRRPTGNMTWAQFSRLEKRYSLPRARVVHGLQSRVAKS